MESHRSLALAIQRLLSHYGREYALDAVLAQLQTDDTTMAVSRIEPGIKIFETGSYDTWPLRLPSIVQFDNGLYAYLADAGSRQIIDPYTGQPSDASPYGHPLTWTTYAQVTISQPLAPPLTTIYVDNVVDNVRYQRLKVAPKRMYVSNPNGTEKRQFGGTIGTFRDFFVVPDSGKLYGEEVRIMGTAHHPITPTGQDFFVDMDDWGNFTGTGQVARTQGYFLADLSDTKPPAIQKSKAVPAAPVKPTRAIADVVAYVPLKKEELYFQYLRVNQQPVRYQVMRRIVVRDFSKQAVDQVLTRGKNGRTIKLLGTFRYKGKTYLLPVMENPDIDPFKYWYGVPEVDEQGNRIVEELPDYSDVPQTVAEVQAELPERRYNWLHHITYWQERLSHGIEKRILRLKGK